MKERFLMKTVQPGAFTAMMAMEKYIATTGIDPLHKELIKIRASQINGCGYCLDLHTKDARKLGETEQRLYLLSVWREAPQFSEAEKTILAMTEEVTLISQKGLTDETYEQAVHHFGQEGTAQLIMAIIAINAWNRIGISSHRIPGEHY
ncbi:carboxymuconolactone decarboxylase family protein [Chitinophaga sp. MM2321]|uniref:carboxymuconolactone decarboxylase family protein n=1 Tax=Chitinophaga sp. MM2321 TaxID=3137178 RepID=UPI0032D58251